MQFYLENELNHRTKFNKDEHFYLKEQIENIKNPSTRNILTKLLFENQTFIFEYIFKMKKKAKQEQAKKKKKKKKKNCIFVENIKYLNNIYLIIIQSK